MVRERVAGMARHGDVDLTKLDATLQQWLRNSDVPGIDRCHENGQWEPDIATLLRFFCGERNA